MTALAIRNADGVLLAHPAADLFPMMDPESRGFRDLVGSITLHGLIEPIVLDSAGRILDGRNRFVACEQAGIKPTFVAFADLKLSDCDEFEYVWSRNITRRNLAPDVRLAISVELHRLHGEALQAAKVAAGKASGAARRGDEQVQESSPADSAPKTRKKVAEQAGVSEHKAQQALNVARDAPEVFEQVKAGKVTLKEAVKQTKPKAAPVPVIGAEQPRESQLLRVSPRRHPTSTFERLKTITKLELQCLHVEKRGDVVRRFIAHLGARYLSAAIPRDIAEILRELEFQGAQHRAAYSPSAVATCAMQLRERLHLEPAPAPAQPATVADEVKHAVH